MGLIYLFHLVSLEWDVCSRCELGTDTRVSLKSKCRQYVTNFSSMHISITFW